MAIEYGCPVCKSPGFKRDLGQLFDVNGEWEDDEDPLLAVDMAECKNPNCNAGLGVNFGPKCSVCGTHAVHTSGVKGVMPAGLYCPKCLDGTIYAGEPPHEVLKAKGQQQ